MKALALKAGKLVNADGKLVLGMREEDMLPLTLLTRWALDMGVSWSERASEAQHEAILGLKFTVKSP